MKPNIETLAMPQMDVRALVMPETIDKEKRTVEVVVSTGAKVLRGGFWRDPYYEELSLDPKHVDMTRMESGAPVLDTHSSYELSNVIGVVERAWLTPTELRAQLRIANTEDVKEIWEKIQDGIIRNISVGYSVEKYEDVTPPDEETRTFRATAWTPAEVSFVPIGADSSAGTRSKSKTENQCDFVLRTETQDKTQGEIVMEPKETSPAPADLTSVRKEEKAAEKKRSAAIVKLARTHKFGEQWSEEMIESDLSIEQVNERALEKLATASELQPQPKPAPQVEMGRDIGAEARRDGLAEALTARAMQGSGAKTELSEVARQFQSLSMFRAAELCVGSSAQRMSKSEIATRAMSTSDFPLIMGNVAAKSLRKAYELEVQTFRPWIVEGTLPDYKEMSRLQLGDIGDLGDVTENGEYKFGSIGEGQEKIKLAKRGLKLKLSEEMIVNDDLSAFARIPRMLGNAASRAESKAVYDVLALNAAMSDGVALFAAGHGNLAGAGTTITAGLAAARAALRKMKTLDGKDFLGLVPAYVICGPDKEEELLKVLNGQIVPTKSSDVNVFKGSATPICENRIAGNQWYVIASPNAIDTVELATLEGMSGPQIDMVAKLEDDQIIWKVKHVFGVKALDHRGMYSNPGA